MKWLSILILLSLAGCARAPGRTASDLGIAVPERWQSGAHPPGEIEGLWWRQFGEPALDAAIVEALANNRDLRAAAARLDAAIAQARIAGAEAWPVASAGLDARRQQQNFIGLPIPGASDQVLTTRATTFALSLTTTWEVDLWGRVRSGRDAARADVEAVRSDQRAARHSLAAQTARAWFALVEADEQARLARQTLASYDTTVGQVRSRYERGLRSPLDLRLAMSSRSSAAALLADRESQREAAARQLEVLLGRYPAGRIVEAEALPEAPPPVPSGLPSELLQRRPDLEAAERRVAATEARVRQARAALFPRISLTASGGTSSDDLADLLSRQFSVWTLAGNVAQPVFEGGRLRAGVRLAKARSQEALENYAAAALRAFGEVETALAQEAHLARRETELAASAEQARAASRLAEERYLRGLETFATVLESQRRALETESQSLLARRARLDARVNLHLALGGDFAGM
jgi:outer membrane protein, multidrug efflux system